MDVPESDLRPVKEDGASFRCDQCDEELSLKISQLHLFGMATVCVDNTTGLFKSLASSVAIVMGEEVVDFLTQRSQMYIAEAASVEGDDSSTSFEELLDNPTELVSVLIDEFASSKRNLSGHVLGWLSSEGRKEKIDYFCTGNGD